VSNSVNLFELIVVTIIS